MEKIKIALLGLGTVGSGVREILNEKQEQLSQKIYQKNGQKVTIEIAKILIRRPENYLEADPSLLTTNYQEILDDDSIKVVVEAMGGEHPATEYMISAMEKKKQVVSANKLAIAKSHGSLEEVARKNQVHFSYEAAVAGTVPILRTINDSLVANEITKVSGIINGTTNYILSKMTNEQSSYKDALKKAQELGFAEADPASDVNGDDAKYKIAILSRLAFGKWPDLDSIDCQGITAVTPKQIKDAKTKGKVIKFLAQSEKVNGNIIASVSLQEIDRQHPLAHVEGAMNAVYLHCDNAGELLFQGAGAGSRPTASAVISDVFEIIERYR